MFRSYNQADKLSKEDLVNDANFQEDALTFLMERQGLQENLTSEEVYDRFMEHMRFHNVNEITTLRDLEYAQNANIEGKLRFGSLIDAFDKVDDGYVNEFSGRVKSELETAKVALANAVAKGDINAQVEANQNLARLAIEEERIKATEAQRKAYEESLKNTGQIGDQPVQNNVQPPKPDPKAEAWAERNEWFGKDEAMTYASFGIHKKLVEEEGFNPSSDEYYEEIDKRLRDEFPQKFNDGGEVQGGKQPAQTVASANRTTSAGRKTVRLTPSQVAIAKKLGVPLEEYAKYVKE